MSISSALSRRPTSGEYVTFSITCGILIVLALVTYNPSGLLSGNNNLMTL